MDLRPAVRGPLLTWIPSARLRPRLEAAHHREAHVGVGMVRAVQADVDGDRVVQHRTALDSLHGRQARARVAALGLVEHAFLRENKKGF